MLFYKYTRSYIFFYYGCDISYTEHGRPPLRSAEEHALGALCRRALLGRLVRAIAVEVVPAVLACMSMFCLVLRRSSASISKVATLVLACGS